MNIQNFQCLFYSPKQSDESLSVFNSFELHHLMMDCFGMAYQQLIFQPSAFHFSDSNEFKLEVFEDKLVVHKPNSVVEISDQSVCSKHIPFLLFAYSHPELVELHVSDQFIHSCVAQFKGHLNSASLSDVVKRNEHKVVSLPKWQRKLRKLKRDPLLFFRDMFGV